MWLIVRPLTKLGYQLHVDGQMLADCGLLCAGNSGTNTDAFLNGDERSIARYLVGVAAITFVLSSLFTILTFIIAPSRFHYLERSIVFLSACYLSVCLAYLVGFASARLFVGGEETEQPENCGMDCHPRYQEWTVVSHVHCSLILRDGRIHLVADTSADVVLGSGIQVVS